MINKINGLYGLVLAGGQSSRMGVDKSLISYHGLPQKDYAFHLLDDFCEQVYTSVSDSAIHQGALNEIRDKFSLSTPLDGILSAFAEHSNVAWLSLPVDMPLVDHDILAFLIKNRDENKVATCFMDTDGKNPEPLLVIWEKSASKLLHAYYKQGKKSPREFLLSADIKLLEVPRKNALRNVNTPQEWKAFGGKAKD